MKRTDAFRKLHLICQRLDEIGISFFVMPLRLYLHGSVLTDKADPGDIDLIFQYQDQPGLDPNELYARMAYGRPLPIQQAISHLRRGMQMVHFDIITSQSSAEGWLNARGFPPDSPMELIWQEGLAWRPILDRIEAHPRAWDAAASAMYKRANELEKATDRLNQAIDDVRRKLHRLCDPVTVELHYDPEGKTWQLSGVTWLNEPWKTDRFPADCQAAAELEAAKYLEARLTAILTARRARLSDEDESDSKLRAQAGFLCCDTKSEIERELKKMGVLSSLMIRGGCLFFLRYEAWAAWKAAKEKLAPPPDVPEAEKW
jgi:hypothetical protein